MIQEEEEEEDDNHDKGGMMMFSQQAPEPSQSMAPAKANERAKLKSLNNAIQQKAITDLSRLLLFKAFAGEPIDRLKCAKEVLGDFKGADRVTSAVYEAAVQRLEAVFGFEVKPAPASTGKLPAKFKDRYYVINTIPDESGQHFRSILSEHEDAAIERGLLMMILAFFFCKGSPRADGSRWLADDILYRLLNSVDENIPASPPNTAALKGSKKSGSSPMSSSRARSFGGKGMSTPNVDQLLERFVHMDYLLMEKTTPTAGADETTTIYAMGPRSLLEIGKKQVIYFCAELLDEAPDPTMLAEIESFQEEEAEEEVEAEAIHA
jgi:hypothetical protein